MNTTVISGRLVRNPGYNEVENEKGLHKIAKFVLAVRRNYSDEVSFIPVKAFAKKAEFARDYLMQGTKVMVEGEIVTGNYEDKDKTEKNHTDKSKGNTPTLEEKFSQYGRFKNVVLSEAELQELMTLFPWDYQKRIDHLSVYMKSSGKEYQNHFATICLWAERDGTKTGMDKYEFQEGESL